jgi:hypothetical protein
MKRLGPLVLAAFKARILNTHPALLPKFGGPGMYGPRSSASTYERCKRPPEREDWRHTSSRAQHSVVRFGTRPGRLATTLWRSITAASAGSRR